MLPFLYIPFSKQTFTLKNKLAQAGASGLQGSCVVPKLQELMRD